MKPGALLKRFEKAIVIVVAALGLTTVLMNLEFSLLEANLYDLRMAKGWNPAASKNIVLVTIDDPTLKNLGEIAPLPLEIHARFLEELKDLKPRGVGYLLDMNRVHELNPDQLSGEWAKRFVQAARKLDETGAFILGTPFDVTGEVLPPYPLNQLPHALAIVHKDGNVFSEDKITRRALTSLYGKPVFHLELAQRLGLVPSGRLPRGSFYIPEVDAQYFYFRYHGSTALPATTAAAGDGDTSLSYARYSFGDILRGQVPAGALENKIVLISTLTREDAGDYAYTPYSKAQFTHPKLAVHATILDSVIQDDGLLRAPAWINWIATFAVTAFVLSWVLNSMPLYGVFATLGLAIVFMAAGHAVFSIKGLWIRESQPLVGIFLGYYLAVPYRLIREYKKRWDYQRKNELLIQVEEMKTNFLSLVTHDLKTPVARIQGLAETILKKAAERLATGDRESLMHIISSTDELNRFITSILELTKVESNRLQIQLESKDVNQLIEKAVDGFRTQSRVAKIKLEANLEPLFPIKLDSSLLSKVLNNLIDNALKYSPAGSSVLVESREVGSWIVISVTDQGIGMSEEERQNLFTRFYRAKNDTTTRVIGTGLGLYLTKYFVEAQNGRVEVVSELGRGSTFKILLPLENNATVPIGLKISNPVSNKEINYV